MAQLGLIASAINLGCSLTSQAAKYRKLGATPLPWADGRVTSDGEVFQREAMAYNVATATRACKEWGLNAAMLQAFSLEAWIRGSPPTATFLELAGQIDSLRQAIANEAMFRLHVAIPADRGFFGEEDKPLGEQVWNAFPSSREDLREAANCIACGRFTASVYHAMCALEPAMKALARSVGVPWNPKSSMWGATLDQIEKSIKGVAAGPKTRGHANRVAFLSQAASEFRYFKDGWRNDTMHARLKKTSKADAELLVGHVQAFLTLLASHVRERRSSTR